MTNAKEHSSEWRAERAARNKRLRAKKKGKAAPLTAEDRDARAQRLQERKLLREQKKKEKADKPAPVLSPAKAARREYLERIEQRSATAPPRSLPQDETVNYPVPPARIVSGGQPGSSRRH